MAALSPPDQSGAAAVGRAPPRRLGGAIPREGGELQRKVGGLQRKVGGLRREGEELRRRGGESLNGDGGCRSAGQAIPLLRRLALLPVACKIDQKWTVVRSPHARYKTRDTHVVCVQIIECFSRAERCYGPGEFISVEGPWIPFSHGLLRVP